MFVDNHLDVLRAAVEANRTRAAWTGYSPITPPDAAAADEIVAAYDGVTLDLCAPTDNVITGHEVSPYTGKALNVSYAAPSRVEALAAAQSAARARRPCVLLDPGPVADPSELNSSW